MFLFLATILLPRSILSGCGVSTSKYNDVVTESDATNSQLTSINNALIMLIEQL
jgi:hypothetical protein